MMSELAGQRVAIANRGEVAIRIAATCRRFGAVPVLLAAESELSSAAARFIGRCEAVGPAGSELDVAAVIAAARRAKADILHPGYGFLSERAELAAACIEAGIRFAGPSPHTLCLCGDKMATRQAAERAGVPVLPASAPLTDDPASWMAAGEWIGFPLFVKPALAGGGRGLRRVTDPAQLEAAVAAARSESNASGAGNVVFLEKALTKPRHIEVQVAAAKGCVLALGDRDCSLQRRHQKLIEEAPAPRVSPELRPQLHGYAESVATAVELTGIATCEFLLDATGALFFLEVNPRLQVEHPVTEAVTGLDLVAWQLIIATDADLPITESPGPLGHAIEARVCAEDPAAGFRPAPGRLTVARWPCQPSVRVDAGYLRGDMVPPAYDSLIAKVIAHGTDRAAAVATLREALHDTLIAGIPTNVPWLLAALDTPEGRTGRITTNTASSVRLPPVEPDEYALAAAAWTLDRPPSADPWTSIGPLRMSGPALLTFHGENWERQITVEQTAAGWQASIAGDLRPLRWWHDEDGVWTVVSGDAVARFAMSGNDDQIEIAGPAGRLLVATGPLTMARAASNDSAGHDGLIRAPIPGRILQIDAQVGHHVERGRNLVTMNAMKIDIELAAPVAGTIAAVSCAVGAQVDGGAVLIQMNPEAPASADRLPSEE